MLLQKSEVFPDAVAFSREEELNRSQNWGKKKKPHSRCSQDKKISASPLSLSESHTALANITAVLPQLHAIV